MIVQKDTSFLTHEVNGIGISQRVTDGFINGTAMCVAHNKLIADWFRNQETIELLFALAEDLGINFNHGISHNSSITSISKAYPQLVTSKRGSPETGGGTYIHPDLAIQLAQWCNKTFAIQVSRWVRDLMVYLATAPQREWDGYRIEGKVTHRQLTDAIASYIERHPELSTNARGWLYTNAAEAVNLAIFNRKAKRLAEELGADRNRLRDSFNSEELLYIREVEDTAVRLIDQLDINPVDAVKMAAERLLIPKQHRLAA